jgi:hypothetical protein
MKHCNSGRFLCPGSCRCLQVALAALEAPIRYGHPIPSPSFIEQLNEDRNDVPIPDTEQRLHGIFLRLITLGSVIFVSPLKSMNCTRLTTDFEKPLSNDFKKLEEK